jgi:NAD(P)H dehydrogenase (quinone)
VSNLAVIYAGDLVSVAEAFATAAHHVSAVVRVRALDEDRRPHTAAHPPADLADLEWADGIAFGTPIGAGSPAPSLMRFLARTEPLWSSGRLSDKAVTVFTDEPEHLAPDSVLHPVYDALLPMGCGDRRTASI